MSNLLDQAIVDAEALKEVALRNAEATILDKFSNQIKEAVEQILEAEEDMLDAEEEAPEEEDPGLEDVELANAEGLELCPCPDETEVVHVDLTDLERQMDAEGEIDLEGEPALSDEEEDLAQTLMPESLDIDVDVLEEIAGNETSHNITLEEELLEELASILDEEDNMGLPADVEAEEAKSFAAQNPADAPYVEESLEINEEDAEAIVEEAMTVDMDLKTLQAGWGPPPEAVFELAEEEILAALQDSESREKHEAKRKALEELQESHNKLETDIEKLMSDRKELIGVVGKLKNNLNESNLSNAKLLYTNKVLMSDSLNERQKNKIVEALSNSESVEEAKVIFETLQSATGSTIKNNQPESLSEAMNKTTSTLILSHRKRDRENTTQNDSSIDRWKILAGLTKK